MIQEPEKIVKVQTYYVGYRRDEDTESVTFVVAPLGANKVALQRLIDDISGHVAVVCDQRDPQAALSEKRDEFTGMVVKAVETFAKHA